ncbi:hypothetical protein HBI18_013160 [Parastagonospora nodorum]|nr:hypothetical protein HBI78_031630 [Parastagonospora nodorum]KAH5108685.1 hypothetical protein HBH72_036310 [Parastagonospora nodorum]KAH5195762.1 hypothetical protein HBH76_048590 [Parastagonospora nodorum]KAH5220737.1 hypothetical protein HBH77_039500 [Parastagonospora nodorum]KAH5476793.1 hypothetical protein HBI28_077170 [Parastagonospora nodorum]
MTSNSDDYSDVYEDDEYWNRWHSNEYEPRLVKPMEKTFTAPWDLPVSDSDLEKLKAGFRPRNFDDKYGWLIEDDNGNISIHVIRHFVHVEEYILHITPKPSNGNGASAKIHSITWNGDLVSIKDDVEKAKETVVVLARAILKCDFENAPKTA